MQEVGDIDVLKLGHHGSKVSVDGELLDVLKPELSLASAGEGNRYGHPSDACIDAVKEAGGVFACTIEHGDITITPTTNGFMRCDASDRDDVVGVWWPWARNGTERMRRPAGGERNVRNRSAAGISDRRYRRRQRDHAVSRMKARLEKTGMVEFNLDERDMTKDPDIESIIDRVNTFPMGSEFRLVILDGCSKLAKAVSEPLVGYLASPSPTTVCPHHRRLACQEHAPV